MKGSDEATNSKTDINTRRPVNRRLMNTRVRALNTPSCFVSRSCD